MSSLKPIKLYSHAAGPNPWKVAIILEELGLPYESEFVDFSVIKKEPFITVNPNGRVPAIEDPNTGITVWESGAILQYLVAQYDKENKISYSSLAEKVQTDQWLFFQVSGQGPYFGQLVWFSKYHPEKVPSAVERYQNEVKRVVSVIDLQLTRTGSEYLVGNKATYADLSFIPWGRIADRFQIDLHSDGQNQAYKAWWEKITSRPAVKKVAEDQEKAMSQ